MGKFKVAKHICNEWEIFCKKLQQNQFWWGGIQITDKIHSQIFRKWNKLLANVGLSRLYFQLREPFKKIKFRHFCIENILMVADHLWIRAYLGMIAFSRAKIIVFLNGVQEFPNINWESFWVFSTPPLGIFHKCCSVGLGLSWTLKWALAIPLHYTTLHPTTPPGTFRPLLDQLESWNLAQTLTRPTWLT